MLDAGSAPGVSTIVLLLLLPVAIMVAGFFLVFKYLRRQEEPDPDRSADAPPRPSWRKPGDDRN